MRKSTWTRMLALCLALVCLVSAAAALTYDLNGDGKTNVWDLQTAVNEEKTAAEQAAVLNEALGGGDELHPNAEGKYEIWSTLGLYNMAKNATAGNSYVLMADIDLGGRNWTPIANFKGQFDGNNKTISNATITENVGADMGFFALLDRYTSGGATVQSVVENLNLRNVNIVVTNEKAQYIGLMTGSSRGIIRNCTTTGSVTDTREAFDGTVYVGTLTGRNNDHDTMPGTVIAGSNTMTVTAGSPNEADKVTGVTSQLALFLSDNIKYKKGITGYSTKELTGMLWQDTTGSIAYKSETEQARRQGAVDHMYKQGTVQWTTSEEISYTVISDGKENLTAVHSTVYIPGRTYVGIPYNGSGLSYADFESVMQAEKDAEGRYVTVTGLENGTSEKTGFAALMGNDCSSAVGWAWASVMPSRVENGGTRVNTTPWMVPNAYNAKHYGVLPTGGYEMLPLNEERYPSGPDGRDTRSIIALNGGAEGMAEYYAKASRGDALMFVEYTLDTATDKWVKGGGHARMLGYDPVIIRDWDGDIDLKVSYVITHEQGDGLFDNRLENGKYETYKGYNLKQTSWRTNYKYTLSVLLTEEGFKGAANPGCGYGYVPSTPQGFSYEGDFRAPYLNAGYLSESTYHPVILPNSGWYYCNYAVLQVKMTIKDADGNTIYEKTVRQPNSARGSAFQNVKLDELFPDAANDLTEGVTYYETIEAQTGTGQWVTALKDKAFTYPSTEILKP